MKVSLHLPEAAEYRIGAVRYEVRAVFSEEGPALRDKIERLLSEKVQKAVCTFDGKNISAVK
ncbi:MAG: hypothetical protein HFG44_08890 [Oscillospiraceae bacterium]|nr:hypothetical protein [Oscillospiraceae bacterium]